MKDGNRNRTRKRLMIFGLLFLSAAAMGSYLFSYIWYSKQVSATTPTRAGDLKLLSALSGFADEVEELSSIDNQYMKLLGSGNTTDLEAVSLTIDKKEKKLRLLVDSLMHIYDGKDLQNENAAISAVTQWLSSVLKNRRVISNLRAYLSLIDEKPGEDGSAVLHMNQMLTEKEERILFLEGELKNIPATRNQSKTDFTSAEATRHLKQMADNSDLQSAKISELTGMNNRLTAENERLHRQKDGSVKKVESASSELKEKITALQQMLTESNADLQLARVDCNLTRVDAGKIIFTARQRKKILAESSGILTALSGSGDTQIRKKVFERIDRLNKVAATSKD